jgi:SAM-dependent methyltransferase
MKLHLGCGFDRKEGWVNVDCQARVKPDLVVDLGVFPWPWESDSIDEIYSSHVFEHLHDALGTMRECYRVLKPGGTLEVVVPFACNYAYFQDPTHYRPWTDITVRYFLNIDVKGEMYCERGFDLVFNILDDKGMRGVHDYRHFLRNLIPRFIRMPLRYIFNSMFDEVHFKVRKPLVCDKKYREKI